MILTETRGSTPFPDLTSSACTVMEAVQSLASVAQKVTTETADEVKLYYHCSVPFEHENQMERTTLLNPD